MSTSACSPRRRGSRSSKATRRWPSASSLRRPRATARPRSSSSSRSCASGGARPHEVEELLSSIDNDELDDPARAQVARRRATNLFFGQGDYSGAVALLDSTHEALSDTVERDGHRGVHRAAAGDGRRGVRRARTLRRHAARCPATSPSSTCCVVGRSPSPSRVAARRRCRLLAEARKLHDAMLGRSPPARPVARAVRRRCSHSASSAGWMRLARRGARRGETRVPAMRDWMLLAEARLDLSVGRPDDHARSSSPSSATAVASVSVRPSGGRSRSSRAASCSRAIETELGSTSTASLSSRSASAACSTPTSTAPTRGSPPNARACRLRVSCLRVAADDARRLGKFSMEAALLHDIARFGDAESSSIVSPSSPQSARATSSRPRAAHAAGIASGDPALLDRADGSVRAVRLLAPRRRGPRRPGRLPRAPTVTNVERLRRAIGRPRSASCCPDR